MKKKVRIEGRSVTLIPMEIGQLDDLWKAADAQEI